MSEQVIVVREVRGCREQGPSTSERPCRPEWTGLARLKGRKRILAVSLEK